MGARLPSLLPWGLRGCLLLPNCLSTWHAVTGRALAQAVLGHRLSAKLEARSLIPLLTAGVFCRHGSPAAVRSIFTLDNDQGWALAVIRQTNLFAARCPVTLDSDLTTESSVILQKLLKY